MRFVEVVQPREREVQTRHVLVLARRVDGFLHGEDALAVAAKVRLEDRQIQQRILVEGAVTVMHGVVKVAVQIVEAPRVVSTTPRVQKLDVVRQRGDGYVGVEHLLKLEGHLVGDPRAQALHAVDLELEEALDIVGGNCGVLFAETCVDLLDEGVVQGEALEVHVEGEGTGAEIAFLPGQECRLTVLDEGSPERDGIMELETNILKAYSSHEAAKNGGPGEE